MASVDFSSERNTRIESTDPIIIKSESIYKIEMEQDAPAFTDVQLNAEVEIEFGITVHSWKS